MKYLLILTMVLAVSVSLAAADCCNCSYTGLRPCSANQCCLAGEYPQCNCKATGCTAYCSSDAEGGNPLTLQTLFSSFKFIDGGIRAFGSAVEEGSNRNWVVQVDDEIPDTRLESAVYYNKTVAQLASKLATDFGVCVQINTATKVINFRPLGGC